MDKKQEVKKRAKEILKDSLSKYGNALRKQEEKKNEPSILDKSRSKIAKGLQSANDAVKKKAKEVHKSVTGPNKVRRFKKWVANGGINAAKATLSAAKTGLHEGRANVIATKIVGNRVLKGKKTTKAERKFLGKQAVNNVKTGVTVGTVVGANVAMGATPAPGMSEALAWGTNKLGMTPKKQRIPKRYEKEHKFSKANGWLDKKSKQLSETKKNYNKKVNENIAEDNKARARKLKAKMKSLHAQKKKDTEHSYDPELNMEVRAENLRNISNKRLGDTDKALSLASKVGGGVAGGVLGNAISKAFHKRKRARVQHLQDKGHLRTDKENQELGKLKKYLSTSKSAFIAGGAGLGAIGGGAAYYKYRKSSDKRDRKRVFNSEV